MRVCIRALRSSKARRSRVRNRPDPPGRCLPQSAAALDRYCRAEGGKPFAQLPPERQDQLLSGLEAGTVQLEGADGKTFFETLLKNVQEGFFADPIYGGNKDMCGWKMIGYPGAHYDYRDWVEPAQRALSASAREHRGASRVDTEGNLSPWQRSCPRKDAVIIGLGWTGSILAHELTEAGLDVIAIERGPWRNTATNFAPNYAQDELRYRIRHELFLQPAQTTFTFRNKMDQAALPIRNWGAFMPPNGVGGGGVHWNAETWRFLPSDFVARTHLTQRYGAQIPAARHDHSGLGRHLR